MFKNLLVLLSFVTSVVSFAGYAPTGPFIGLGCSISGGCMRWVPAAESSKIVQLSGGNVSVTAVNYYGLHSDASGAAVYQVAATGSLDCYGYLSAASSTTATQVGYGDTSVSATGTASAPTNVVCLSGDTSCATANSSSFRHIANSTASWGFFAHSFRIPASKYPFIKAGGTDGDAKLFFFDCYQN